MTGERDLARRQRAVVEYLRDRLAIRLADRGGERHPAPWTPRQNVVCGVLPVARPPQPSSPDRGPSGMPVNSVRENAEQPSLGLDVRTRVSSDGDINVCVDVAFAVYLEEYATLLEAREHALPSVETTSDGPVGEPEGPDASLSDSVSGEEAPRPIVASEGSVETDPDNAGQSTAPRRQPRRVNVIGAWRRADINVEGICLTVPRDESILVTSEPFTDALKKVIGAHYARPEASRPFRTRTRTVPTTALETDQSYIAAIRDAEDPTFSFDVPQIQVAAFVQRLAEENEFLVSVTISNSTLPSDRPPHQDLAAYDVRLTIQPGNGAAFTPQQFSLAPADYRYADISTLPGHGRSCVAYGDRSAVWSETLPCFVQPVIEHRRDHVASLTWHGFAEDSGPLLDSIDVAMESYASEWQAFLGTLTDSAARQVSVEDRARFLDELRRLRLGRRAIAADSRLATAFKLANRTFELAYADSDKDTWRVFQVAFIVSQLAALAAREHQTPEFRAELEWADVLWIPTGGGKTEAYMGLVLVALFYDRLRGKLKGTTSWLKFPLRMLSVQQLTRVLRLMVVAETLRVEAGLAGDPFTLGYLVGGANTPNSLEWARGDWWPGMARAVTLPDGALDANRIVARCPYCDRDAVGLRCDLPSWRLLHVCRSCRRTLPVLMSDDEIYRYAPSVLVGTIDKLTGFAFFGEFTNFSHGPRFSCPNHGFFTYPHGGAKRCLAGDACSVATEDYAEEETWHDPVPALIIQDELHLVREELGTFDSHYEGMLAEVQRATGSHLPSKIIAASATIEDYENQVRQVYGRRPRSFPTPGFARSRSFYLVELDQSRRLYVGVLPHYRHKEDVAAIVQAELITSVTYLQDSPEAAELLGIPELSADDLANLLFDYEVSLSYVNSKAAGDAISDELDQLSRSVVATGGEPIERRVLTGRVKIAELAEPISRIEEDTLATPRRTRLRALVGTSVVSHGVDLTRLNCMVMAGLPATMADYIQATSRSGRARVGLVVTVFDPFSRRERSSFCNFDSTHRFLDRMVEPVPVNKYARFGSERTLPGIAMSLLWDSSRDPALGAPVVGVRQTRNFRQWWNERSADLAPVLTERISRAYRSVVADVAERVLEDELVARTLDRWERYELPTMMQFDKDRTVELFRTKVLSSFRDIDDPVEFAPDDDSRAAYVAVQNARLAGDGDPRSGETSPPEPDLGAGERRPASFLATPRPRSGRS